MEEKVSTNDKRIISIATVLYLCINVLFVDKYSSRISEWNYLYDIIYLAISIGLFFIIKWLHKRSLKVYIGISYIVYTTIMILIQYSIDPITLQVDRWSAIHYFLYNLFHGIYPYAAQTHLGGYGSPFPIWQIIHIPFYLLGNVGLSFFVALALLIFVIAKCKSFRMASIVFFLIACSPAINYEIIVRSDLVTNFIVICTLCEWLRYKDIHFNQYSYMIAIISGLCASTRLSAIIPIAFLYGYEFLQLNWRKQLCFVITAFSTFSLTFLPFMLWNGTQLFFFDYNPFVLQTRQGSPIIFFVFALCAISLTIYKKNHLQHFNLYAGGLLTFIVIITFTYNMTSSGNYNLYSSAYDITYFNMALPFYIYEIASSSALYFTTYYDAKQHT